MNQSSRVEKFLPLGTVVLLKTGKKKLMITGYCCTGKEAEGKVFDYSGCLYPEGIIKSDQALMFNHDQIDKVYHVGYVDEESQKFGELLKKIEVEVKNKVEKKES